MGITTRKCNIVGVVVVASLLVVHSLWYSYNLQGGMNSDKSTAAYDNILLEFLDTATTPTTNSIASSRTKAIQATRTGKKIKKRYDSKNKHDTIKPVEYIRSFRKSFDPRTKYQRPLTLFHIPKTAGTSIEDVAASHNISWGACAFPRYKPKAVLRCPKPPHIIGQSRGLSGKFKSALNFWHMPRTYLPIANVDPYTGHEIFAVVRDVYKKMISGYYHVCTGRRSRSCDASLQHDPNHMNEWIMKKLDSKRGKEYTHGIALHSEEQYALVVGPNEVRIVDYILHLENLEDEFNRLMDVFDMENIHLNKVSNAHGNRSVHAEEALSVEHLFPDTINELNKVYATDFEAFQYKRIQHPAAHSNSNTRQQLAVQDKNRRSSDINGVEGDSTTTTTTTNTGTFVSVEEDDLIYSNKRLSPVIVPEYKLIFFDVPKVASTVWMILMQKMSGIDRSKLHRPDKVRSAKFSQLKFLWQTNLTYANQIMNDPTWTRAIFVRDPHERILSAYLDKGVSTNFNFVRLSCCKGDKANVMVHNIIPTEDGRRVTIKKRPIPSEECLSSKGKNSFEDFVNFVPRCRNDHWYPQSERMDSKHWKLINFVGHFDNLQDDAKALLQRLGGDAWEKFGRTGWGAKGTDPVFGSGGGDDEDAANKINVDNIRNHAQRASQKMRTYYNSSPLWDRVTDYYRRDYNLSLLGLKLKSLPQ